MSPLSLGPLNKTSKDHVYTNYYKPEDPNKKKKQLIWGGVVIFVFLSVLSLVISTRPDPAQIALMKLAAMQNETINISDDFYKELGTAQMRRNDAETRAILLTNNYKLGGELRRLYNARSIPGAYRKAAQDQQVYADLEKARQLTRLDQAYAEEMSQQLTNQIAQLKLARSLAKSQQTKAVLDELEQQLSGMRARYQDEIKEE